jgi:hypothetical protein
VTADDGSFDSGVLKPGEFFDFRFDALGKWTYHSELDPGMTGSVIVGQEATLPGDSADDASMPPTETSTLPTHDAADEAADKAADDTT